MVVIRKALRREFGLLPRLVTTVSATDTARARLLARHASSRYAAYVGQIRATADEALVPGDIDVR